MDVKDEVGGNGSWQNFNTSSSTLHPVEKTTFNISEDCQLLEYNPYANEENEISLATLRMVVRVIGGGFIPLVCLFGCPINVLNAVVFYKQGLRERINMLLFCLALCDFVVEAFLFVSTIEYLYTQVLGKFVINGPLAAFVTNNISALYGSVYVSGFITALISFERCMCVSRPLVAKTVLKTRTMLIIVAVTAAALMAFIYLLSAEKYRLRCGYYPPGNLTLKVHYPSDFYQQHEPLMVVLNMVIYGLMLPIFFVLTTVITTAITAVKLKGAAAVRRHSLVPSLASGMIPDAVVTLECKEVSLTKTLIAVSCLFIITTIPNVVLRIAPLVVDEFRLGGRKENLLLCGICFVYLANAINSALNFVFYYNMGTRFRETVKRLFRRKRRPSVQGNFLIDGPLVSFVMKYLSVLYGSVYVSGFITTLISFERCICVTRPLVAKNALKTRTMAIIVAVTSVVLIVFIYIVSVEKYGVRCGYVPEQNRILHVHYPSKFYQQNRAVMVVLNMVVYGVLLPSFFILTTTITTTITAAKLRGAANWRHSMLPPTPTTGSVAQLAAVDTMEHKEIALTKMLIAVSCLFVITTIPNAVLRVAILFEDEVRLGGKKENLLLCAISVVYLANAINSAFNFVFYYNMGTRFRESVKSLFSRGNSSHATNPHRFCV